jgi:UDP-N-acetylmuramoyl-tripeptide--D-alanyl-D-alanine ligase
MKNNIARFSADDLALAAGTETASWFPAGCTGISTDTRTLLPGSLFIPLQGETHDGHSHIPAAIQAGAAGIIVEKQRYSEFSTHLNSFPHIIVENSLLTLGALARFHRMRFDIPVIAIAGAAGKTSTKDCAAGILSRVYTTLSTEANFNNRIGVPLMLLQLNEEHQAAVIEIGTNEPGEIQMLSSILRPTHGLITNIGKEHLEKLIDLDGVEKEETALFHWLEHNGGTRIINTDDERLCRYAAGKYYLSYGFTAQHADVRGAWSLPGHGGMPEFAFSMGARSFRTKLQMPGNTGALTALAATAVALAVNIPAADIAAALAEYIPPRYHGYGRMALQSINGAQVLNDTYNANPASMHIALDALQSYRHSKRRIAVVGDMRELGSSAAAEHTDILQKALSSGDLCICTGPEMQAAANSLKAENLYYAATPQECAYLLHQLHAGTGDTVLVKGSRGMKMEDVLIHWARLAEQSTEL